MVDFPRIAAFPDVIGSIDDIQIAIKTPSREEYVFVNRKKFHSINVMDVCNADLKFLDLIAKWPGTTHDSFVRSILHCVNYSKTRQQEEDGCLVSH